MPESDHDLTLITPTADRQAALRMCQRWMQRQTFDGRVQWLIVDDGEHHSRPTLVRDGWTVTHVRKPRAANNNVSLSFRGNLATGLMRASSDRICIIEDDDHYKPSYLQWVSDSFDAGYELIGEARARYYDLRRGRWRRMANRRHASLCQTSFGRSAVVPWLAGPSGQLRTSKRTTVDIRLWRKFRRQLKTRLLRDSLHVTGMKCLPGRTGITHESSLRIERTQPDRDYAVLRNWVGSDDTAAYRSLVERTETSLTAFSDYFRRAGDSRDVLVIGKGPTFGHAGRWLPQHPRTLTIGLNHVVDRMHVDVAHVIDLDVLDQVPAERWFSNCERVVIPWRPHVGYQPSEQTLDELSHPTLKRLKRAGRLCYYNLSSALLYGFVDRPPGEDIQCSTFSGEAVCRLLVSMGVQQVHTAGVDGGRSYHPEFDHLTPLTNGRESFDNQTARIREIPANIVPV
jgi:hypothetical protein